jgi:glycine cleavage system H lipoate-binding protein
MEDVRLRRQEMIRWKSDFHDLPLAARKCRHEFSGEFKERTCDNAFACNDCTTHAKLIAHSTQEDTPVNIREDGGQKMFGFTMPLDRMYHRGHTWVREEEDGTMTVGLDDLGSHLIGKPDAVDLPATGSHLHTNGTAWRLHKNGTEICIVAPISGEVIETGSADQGWYLKIRPVGEKPETRHLLRGKEIQPWLTREMERLQGALAVEGVGASLADGGEAVQDFPMSFPSANWDSVWGEMFLES